MKTIIQSLLMSFAGKIVRRHQPVVIAITGSVGKTSTRNAVAAVLKQKFRLQTGRSNYNNEFGVPLSIIGEDSPGKSVFGWLRILGKAFFMAFFGAAAFPEMLVLEFGADRPGDIARLCAMAKPKVAVLTAITPVHAANFPDLAALVREKKSLLDYVDKDGLAVLSYDDEQVLALREAVDAPTTTYGFADRSAVKGENYSLQTRTDFSFEPGEEFSKINFDIVFTDRNQRLPATLHNHLGRSAVRATLAAVTVALYFGLTTEEILAGLDDFLPQAGRMRPVSGIKGTLLLDDSYNAAPASVRAALEVLGDFVLLGEARRIAVLGSMAELGQYSEQEHQEIGHDAVKAKVDLLVTVGEAAESIDAGARAAGLADEAIKHFANSVEAGRWLDKEVKKGDIILIKGSQSMRTEKIVKDLMAEPMKAKELLVRQGGKWLNS